MWGPAAECHLQPPERLVYLVARLCSVQSFLSLIHRRRVAGLSMLHQVNSKSYSNQCLFSEFPPAAPRVRYTRTAAAAHPLEFEVSWCRTSNFARSFLPAQVRTWKDLPYTVSYAETLDASVQGCCQPLVASLSCVFFSFPWCRSLWGWESNLWTTLFFPLLPVLLILIIRIIIKKSTIILLIIILIIILLSIVRYCISLYVSQSY